MPRARTLCFTLGLLCTTACGDKDPVVCVYEGTEYSEGSSWDASDGCNTCECIEDYEGAAVVDCTEYHPDSCE